MAKINDSESESDNEVSPAKVQDHDSSSSDSDIENYLQKPENLNLNSSFFKVDKSPGVVKPKSKYEQTPGVLSDSDSDDPLSVYTKKDKDEPVASTSQTVEELEVVQIKNADVFKEQNQHAQELEEAKKQVEAYISRRMAEKASNTDEVDDLLAAGEKPFDLKKDLAEVGFHPSDFESDNASEKEDWEEVEETEEKNVIPKEGVQITVSMSDNMKKKKKGIDLMDAIKRRMNRFKKDQQVLLHKVHLLGWIAHGNFINNILNKDNIMALALSLLPTKECYPPARTNLKYLEQITKWYHKAVKYAPDPDEKHVNIEAVLKKGMSEKVATSSRILVYIFVSMLRALGMQCRIVLSLQVEPLRPPASELCSLKKETTPKKEASKSVKNEESKLSKNKTIDNTSKTVKTQLKKSPNVNKSSSNKESEKDTNKSPTENKAGKTTVKKSPNVKKTSSKDEKSSKPDLNKLKSSPEMKTAKVPVEKSPSVKKTSSKEDKSEQHSKLNLNKLKSPIETKADKSHIKKSPAGSQKAPTKKTSPKTNTNHTQPEVFISDTDGQFVNQSVNVEDAGTKQTISNRTTRSRTKSSPTENKDNFKKPQSSTSLKPTTSKVLRSKSASNVDKVKSKNELQVPKTTKVTRSKSATNETKKQNIVSSIDETVAVLEALETPKKSVKNTNNEVHSSSSCDEEDFLNKSSWRKSKSPQMPKLENEINEPKPDQQPKVLAKTRSKTKLPETNPALLDSIFQSDDERVNPKNKNKIKVRLLPKRTLPLPQVDGNIDDFITTDTSADEEMFELYQFDGADDKPSRPKLKMLKMHSQSSNSDHTPSPTTSINLGKLKSPMKGSGSSQLSSSSQTSCFSPDLRNVKDDIVQIVKREMRERRQTANRSYKEESDSDFAPAPKKRKATPTGKVKQRVLPRSQLDALAKMKAAEGKKKVRGIDIWVEVFLEEEEKWISADVVTGKVHCIKDLHDKATHPISYILSWDNLNKVKDVTKRYCPNWNTVTRKLRADPVWWNASLKPFIGVKTARDREEDEDLARLQLDQPLPKTISEYKDHPLYVLKRHLLKFQALYPPDTPTLGFIRNEAVYPRDCVYTLHSRDIWLKEAKVVRPGEDPYKIVKARPKWDKLSNSMITDQLLEIFGVWQVQDYDPPTAENGMVPRNAYGNIELFKPCMLPKKCVHLQLPGLKKVAAKLKIDCAPAVTGFDFHGGWNHAIYDGFVVCEEFKDVLIAAWEQEQEEITKREQEKYEKRVYGNWRRLIKAALIRRRLKMRYDFTEEKPGFLDEEEPEKVESPPKNKRPKFMKRK